MLGSCSAINSEASGVLTWLKLESADEKVVESYLKGRCKKGLAKLFHVICEFVKAILSFGQCTQSKKAHSILDKHVKQLVSNNPKLAEEVYAARRRLVMNEVADPKKQAELLKQIEIDIKQQTVEKQAIKHFKKAVHKSIKEAIEGRSLIQSSSLEVAIQNYLVEEALGFSGSADKDSDAEVARAGNNEIANRRKEKQDRQAVLAPRVREELIRYYDRVGHMETAPGNGKQFYVLSSPEMIEKSKKDYFEEIEEQKRQPPVDWDVPIEEQRKRLDEIKESWLLIIRALLQERGLLSTEESKKKYKDLKTALSEVQTTSGWNSLWYAQFQECIGNWFDACIAAAKQPTQTSILVP